MGVGRWIEGYVRVGLQDKFEAKYSVEIQLLTLSTCIKLSIHLNRLSKP